MRDIHSLTDATKETLTDNVKAVSSAMGKNQSYFYAILKEDKTDPFAPFEKLYRGALKAGLSTIHWDNELEYARQRYGKQEKVKSESECFTDKMQKHSSTVSKFVQFIADGKLTLEEIKELENCLNEEEQNLEMIRTMLNFKKQILEG